MRRSFFIKIDEEIVTTITFLRFSPSFFDPYPAEICMRFATSWKYSRDHIFEASTSFLATVIKLRQSVTPGLGFMTKETRQHFSMPDE